MVNWQESTGIARKCSPSGTFSAKGIGTTSDSHRTPIARPHTSPPLPCKQCDVGAGSVVGKSSALSAEPRGQNRAFFVHTPVNSGLAEWCVRIRGLCLQRPEVLLG
jgi:hypothetical protein